MSEPIKRPTAADTEDDLLRLQAEFMKNTSGVEKDVIEVEEKDLVTDRREYNVGVGSVNRKRKMEKEPCSDDREVYQTLEDHDKSDLVSVLTNICELDISNKPITTPISTARGFPCVKDFRVSEEGDSQVGSSRQKKSLFARQYDKRYQFVPRIKKDVVDKPVQQHATSSFLHNVLPAERMAIEDQTNKILDQMSEEEKREQAEKIFKNMDPKLVEFLKKRKREVQEQREAEKIKSLQNKPTPSGNDSQADTDVEAMDVVADDASCCNKDDFLHPASKKVEIEGESVVIPVYVKPGHHPNMGVLEPEKLQWMSSAGVGGSGKPPPTDNQEAEVRFDFDGKLVPRGTEIHPDRGLHHHGEEADQAGYTLDELFILSRSTVLRQRQIALETLVHVTQRARHAMYTGYVKQSMLHLLLDSGIVQLYRHALDSTEYELALQGLAALLLAPTEVFIQDELYPHLSLYTLQPVDDVTKEMDHDAVIATDVIRLLVDSQLPQRLWYLLTKHKLTGTMVDNILNIVQHIAQHSLHVAMVFMRHRVFLDKIVELFLPTDLNHVMSCDVPDCLLSHPSNVVIKILRILSSHSKSIAEKFLTQYTLDSTIKLYLSLNHKDFKGGDMLRCQVEVARLWGVMLRWGLGVNVYTAIYPLLVRELSSGGQRSVKLTTALIHSLTTGLRVFPWQDVGAVYHPILASVMSWAHRPPSEKELPPGDDIALISSVFSFLCSFIKLHHTKHFDLNLVEQVTDLVNKLVGPLVTGTMCDNALSYMIHCREFLPNKPLKVPSLPTLELHQYYQQTNIQTRKQSGKQTHKHQDIPLQQTQDGELDELPVSDTLDLSILSEAGEKLLLFFTCSQFIQQICLFLSAAFSINKELSEPVISFLTKCSQLSRLSRQYRKGEPVSNIPDLVFHSVILLQYEYLMLAHRALKRGGVLSDEQRDSLLLTGIGVVSELRPGFECHQFNLISGPMFDGQVNRTCQSCGALFMKSFEAAVSRDIVMKSQEFWNPCDVSKQTSLFLGKLVAGSRVSSSWVFLSDDIVTSLPEPTLLEYLTFLEHLVVQCRLQSVPVCVQLIYVMKIFMLPSQPFLQPKVSQFLQKFLDYFSKLPFIDFKQSKLTGYPSFYDFFNTFCGSYEAEGFCDPVFAGFILLPTRCDYALTYRRLLWVERIDTLMMLRTATIEVRRTLRAPESDADLMSIYLSALKNGLTGLPKVIALHHVVRFFTDERVKKDDKLLSVMLKHVSLCSDQVKEELLKLERVNEFNEVLFYEKVPVGRKEKFNIY